MENNIPSQPEMPVHHRHLHPGVWATALLIVTALVGYLVWASQSRQWPFVEGIDQRIVNSEKNQANNSSLSEVEGWQTYRNEEYGFEVKYPADIRMINVAITDARSLDDSILFIVNVNEINDDPTRSRTGITISVEEGDKPVAQCLIALERFPAQASPGAKSIGNLAFSVYKENFSDSAMGGLRSLVGEYRALLKNRCYRINSDVVWRSIEFVRGTTDNFEPTIQELEEEENWIRSEQQLNDQILSTFRFIEIGSPNVYKNSDYGFSFYYPEILTEQRDPYTPQHYYLAIDSDTDRGQGFGIIVTDYGKSEGEFFEFMVTEAYRNQAVKIGRCPLSEGDYLALGYMNMKSCQVQKVGDYYVLYGIGLRSYFEGISGFGSQVIIFGEKKVIIIRNPILDIDSAEYKKALDDYSKANPDIEFPGQKFMEMNNLAENYIKKELDQPSARVKAKLKSLEEMVNSLKFDKPI